MASLVSEVVVVLWEEMKGGDKYFGSQLETMNISLVKAIDW